MSVKGVTINAMDVATLVVLTASLVTSLDNVNCVQILLNSLLGTPMASLTAQTPAQPQVGNPRLQKACIASFPHQTSQRLAHLLWSLTASLFATTNVETARPRLSMMMLILPGIVAVWARIGLLTSGVNVSSSLRLSLKMARRLHRPRIRTILASSMKTLCKKSGPLRRTCRASVVKRPASMISIL